MDALQTYLDTHYLDSERMASACSIPPQALAAWIEAGLVPRPSHVITADGMLQSPVFGRLPATDAAPGEYHHRGHVRWVAMARDLQAVLGTTRAREALEARFRSEFAAASAEVEPGERERQSTHAWDNFIRGVHGVCVADPSRVDNIARKERLQAALSGITANGTCGEYAPDVAAQVLEMVDAYAAVSMPFAPPEYPHSSRKRLVDDLRDRLVAIVGHDQPESAPCVSPA